MRAPPSIPDFSALPAGRPERRPGAGWRWAMLLVAWTAGGPLLGRTAGAGAADVAEAPPTVVGVKASYLTKLPLFVTWPARVFPDRSAPVVIGILGDDPFGSWFDDAVRTLQTDGRGFEIRRFKEFEGLEVCHILFVGSSETGRLPRLLAVLRDRPVLTVGDLPGFAAQGGMFNFIIEEDRVRFECNREAVRRAGLKVSGKLLQISRIVRD